MHRPVTALTLALTLLSPSCGNVDKDPIDSAFSQPLTSSEEVGVLAFVNDCPTTFAMLDLDAALDVRAARGITERRDGGDSACGSADDEPFVSMSDLDDVPWVGDVALSRLVEHATLLGYISDDDDAIAGTFDGVTFTGPEARAVLAIANGASLEILDIDVALDSRAATAIVAARPFDAQTIGANMHQLAAASYVGKRALERLKSFIEPWQACSTPTATIKGAEYSSLQVHDALDMLNYAPTDVMMDFTGIGSVIAGRIEHERPFESIDQLANVNGIGPKVAGTIRDETETRWCTIPGARCGCPSDASYRPPLVTFDENGLYFLLAYRQWGPERSVDSGFLSHDGNEVVLTDVQVADDPDSWQQITTVVFDELWNCCLQHQFFGEPLEIGPKRKGVLHLGRVINADDDKTYVMAFWQDIDDASFAWLFEKDTSGLWVIRASQFLN